MGKHPRPQRQCILCGATPVTSEHLWPRWLSERFPRPPGSSVIEKIGKRLRDAEGKIEIGLRERKLKGVKPGTQSMDVLCGGCNNEWGSVLERTAQPVITKLLNGEKFVIGAAEQETIARWLTLKFLVVDGDSKELQATPPDERKAFRNRFEIPDPLQIWIVPLADGKWSTSYLIHSADISITGQMRNDEAPVPNNVSTFTFGIGRVLAFSFYCRMNSRRTLRIADEGVKAVQIWPRTGTDIRWPPGNAIDDTIAEQLAFVLNNSLPENTVHTASPRRIKLKVVTHDKSAFTLIGKTNPLFGGNELDNLLCGTAGCDQVLAEGVSLETLRERFIVESAMHVVCNRCGAYNLLPVRGTKRQQRR